jgi:PhnB protein
MRYSRSIRLSEEKNMTSITPYLDFAGRCEEAIDFYRDVLGAEVDMMMRYNESPEPPPPGMLQAGFEKKLMHVSFRIAGVLMMASDGCDDTSKFSGFQLTLSVRTEAVAQRYFAGLAAGGIIRMPLTKTFWSPCFGMVTDRFGLSWMISVPGPTN